MFRNNYLKFLLGEKQESRLIVQNMQTSLMLLMMPMLIMKMMIIYPGKKVPRFVLSHSKFRYFLVTMFLAPGICICIYALYYEFRILFMYLLFSILQILCIVFIFIFNIQLLLLLLFICLLNYLFILN